MTSAAQIDFVEFSVRNGLNADTAHRGPTPLVVLHTVDREQARQTVLAAGGVLARDISTFSGGRRFHFTGPAGTSAARQAASQCAEGCVAMMAWIASSSSCRFSARWCEVT